MSSMTMHAGEDRTIDVATLLRGRPTSLTGATLRWEVTQGGTTLFEKSSAVPGEIDITDEAAGQAIITVDDTDTSGITEHSLLQWELWMEVGPADTRIADGVLLVLP